MESGLGIGIVAVEEPVAGVDRALHLLLYVLHAAADAVLDAGGVGDNDAGSFELFRLVDGTDELGVVRAHGDLGDVDVAVGHHHLAQVLLGAFLAGGGKLCNRADLGGLGGLSAGVGVYLCVDDQDVEILSARNDMVEAAEADVVGPAVSAVHPEGFLGKLILVAEDHVSALSVCRAGSGDGFKHGDQSIGSLLRLVEVIIGFHPLADGSLQRFVRGLFQEFGETQLLRFSLLAHGQDHTKGELGVIFKEGIGPGRTLSPSVYRVGNARRGGTPGLGAARRVGPVDPASEELGEELGVGRFAAARAGG